MLGFRALREHRVLRLESTACSRCRRNMWVAITYAGALPVGSRREVTRVGVALPIAPACMRPWLAAVGRRVAGDAPHAL